MDYQLLQLRVGRVGRPAQDLYEFQEEILSRFREGETIKAITESLWDNYGLKINSRTVQRRLKEWGVTRRTKTIHHNNLDNQIMTLFFQCGLSDDEMCLVLQKQGFTIGPPGIRGRRRRLGLHRKLSDYTIIEARIQEAVQNELNKGNIEGYRRGYLHTYFRSKQHIVSRDRLFQIVKELDPEGVNRRSHDLQHTRGDFSVPGPNHLWSIDGHDKLAFWGFQIYAGIDAYSRYITWIYIGNSNRTGFSVLRQYLDTLKSERKQPRFIRSDKGDETTMLAAAHHALYTKHNPEASISDCYWYGTSTSNQRIEAWWSQLTKSCIGTWRDYFLTLNEDHLFEQNQASDRIAILAVYMPLVRNTLCDFVRLWNVHSIRKQKNRPNGVFGKPFFLYFHPERQDTEDYGLLPDETLVDNLLEEMNGWDIDEYLPEQTLNWCQMKLHELGYPSLKIEDVFPDGSRHHCSAYLELRECLKEHIASGEAPQLTELETPTQERLQIISIDDQRDDSIEEATLEYEVE